eukprot:670671-Prymnesium_polylepis.1
MGPPRHVLWVAPRPHMRNDTRAMTRACSDSIAPTSTAASAARGSCRHCRRAARLPPPSGLSSHSSRLLP